MNIVIIALRPYYYACTFVFHLACGDWLEVYIFDPVTDGQSVVGSKMSRNLWHRWYCCPPILQAYCIGKWELECRWNHLNLPYNSVRNMIESLSSYTMIISSTACSHVCERTGDQSFHALISKKEMDSPVVISDDKGNWKMRSHESSCTNKHPGRWAEGIATCNVNYPWYRKDHVL